MHELAVLNGTVKDVDMKCLNCGKIGHKTWQCSESSAFSASVICNACGGVGHVSKFDNKTNYVHNLWHCIESLVIEGSPQGVQTDSFSCLIDCSFNVCVL